MRMISKFLVVLAASATLLFVPAVANASPAAHPTIGYQGSPAITYHGTSPAIGNHPGVTYHTGVPGIGYYG